MSGSHWIGPLCAFLSSVTWAVGSSTYAHLSKTSSPYTVNLTRAWIALPLFVISVAMTGEGRGFVELYQGVGWRECLWLALSALASYGLGDVVFLNSARRIGVPAALAIASTYPLWATVISMAFMGRALEGRQWLGLLLSVLGIIGVILHGQSVQSGGARVRADWGRGVVLAFVTSLFWSLNSVSVAQAGQSLHPGVANTVRMSFAIAMSLIFGTLQNKGQVPGLFLPRATLTRRWPIFAMEAFGGSYLFLIGLTHTTLAVGVTLSSLAPVLAVPIAVMQGEERFSWVKTFWIAGVVLGVWLLV